MAPVRLQGGKSPLVFCVWKWIEPPTPTHSESVSKWMGSWPNLDWGELKGELIRSPLRELVEVKAY